MDLFVFHWFNCSTGRINFAYPSVVFRYITYIIELFIFQDIGVTATTWDMYDTYKLVAEMEAKGKFSDLFKFSRYQTISKI